MEIRRTETSDVADVVTFALRAWAPVFESIAAAMDPEVFAIFYPDWPVQQRAAIEKACTAPGFTSWVAVEGGAPVGFASATIHAESTLGEIHMVAVDPDHQRRGIARQLTETAMSWMREQGLEVAMVETGADPGHLAARRTYESAGFRALMAARYFAKL